MLKLIRESYWTILKQYIQNWKINDCVSAAILRLQEFSGKKTSKGFSEAFNLLIGKAGFYFYLVQVKFSVAR